MSNDTAANVQNIEVSLEHARKVVEKRDNMNTLFKNRHFKQLIVQGYFEKEPVRLAALLAHPSQQSPEDQAMLAGQLRATAELRQYFNKIRVYGDMMDRDVITHEATLVEIENGEHGSDEYGDNE